MGTIKESFSENPIKWRLGAALVVFGCAFVVQLLLLTSRGIQHCYSIHYTVAVGVITISALIALFVSNTRPIGTFRVFSLINTICIGIMIYCHYQVDSVFPTIAGMAICDVPIHIAITTGEELKKFTKATATILLLFGILIL